VLPIVVIAEEAPGTGGSSSSSSGDGRRENGWIHPSQDRAFLKGLDGTSRKEGQGRRNEAHVDRLGENWR